MKVKKVKLTTYYNIDGEYLSFPDNPLHNKVYENVNVKVNKTIRTIAGIDFEVDIIKITGCEDIECEFISQCLAPDGTLVIKLCQDWG
jgi:small-conductance mechanosensitive channel